MHPGIHSSPSDQLVTVTGASGFIAMHCILELLQAGYRVRGTLRTLSREDSVRTALERHVDPRDRLEFVEADLTRDAGWTEATSGAVYLLHVASPLPRKPPKHEDELIVPARDGVLRVLGAATQTGVRRVVMTSSTAAVLYGHVRDGSKVFDERDWSNLDDKHIGAYQKSKTLAELAAWDFVGTLPLDQPLELVSINPGMVLGPVLDNDYGTSGEVVKKLMARELPGCPDNSWAMVDVRDVATMHLKAMTSPHATGKRFICAAEHASMQDVALILQEHFAHRGYNIPTQRIPSWVLRIVSIFDQTARLAVPELGQRHDVSSQRACEILGFKPRSLKEMTVSMGESLIEHGVV